MSTRSITACAALAAALPLLAGCGEDEPADATSRPTPAASTASDLPDGVRALPGEDPGADFATLDAGRYRIRLGDRLAFDVEVRGRTYAHDDGLFLAHGRVVLKTELADADYGVPADPCTDQRVKAAGTSVDELVEALSDLAPYDVSRPTPVQLGGADGTYLEARIPDTFDASQCTGGKVQLPGEPATAVGGKPPYLGRWWVLDVDGQRVVVQQNCWGCTPAELDGEAGIPRSITFTPAS